MGFITTFMLLLNFVGLPITLTGVFIGLFLMLIGFNYPLIKSPQRILAQYKYSFEFRGINFLWLLGILGVSFLFLAITIKNLYWIPISYDTIAGYDLMAKIVASEGYIVSDWLFEDSGKAISGSAHRLTYPFLLPGALALAYLSGAALSKIITSYLLFFFIFAFYGIQRRFLSPAAAILSLGFLLLSNEMYGHAAMIMTNLPQAMYLGIGTIALVVWLQKRERPYFWLAAIFLAFNLFTRSEGLILTGVIFSVLLWDILKSKEWKDALRFSMTLFAPFILWQIFMLINGLGHAYPGQSLLVKGIVTDSAKFKEILTHVSNIIPDVRFYGLSIYAFLLILIANLYFTIRHKDQINLLYIILIGWIAYTLLFYQIDYQWDSLRNVMYYSYKRGMFCFLPLIWFYFFNSHLLKVFFTRYEGFIFTKKRSNKNRVLTIGG